jgi:hypothetical protein
MMKVAFYKGERRLFNRLVRWWTKGSYSHVELAFWCEEEQHWTCYSSSFLDGGVRKTVINLDSGNWDLVDVSDFDEVYARNWYEERLGCGYDVMALFGFFWRVFPEDKGKYFCSESAAAALKFREPWRFDPNTFHAILASI